MILHFLNIFFRFLLKNKVYTIINLIGLSFGFSCFIILIIWQDYEKVNKGYNVQNLSLYRIGTFDYEITERIIVNAKYEEHVLFPQTPASMRNFIIEKFPNIKISARFGFDEKKVVKSKNKSDNEYRFAFADPEIFEILNLKIIEGNIKKSEFDSNNVIITESSAEKYFGEENPIGRTITVDSNSLNIVAVIKDIPDYYKMQFDFLAPLSLTHSYRDSLDNDKINVNTFFLIEGKPDLKSMENTINTNFATDAPGGYKIWRLPQLPVYESIFKNSDRIEDDSDFEFFSILIVFILFSACLNYIILSTALGSKRAVETGIRKVFGAGRIQIGVQFLLESIFLSFLSFLLSYLFLTFFLQIFNAFTGLHLNIPFSLTSSTFEGMNNNLLIIFPVLILITGIVAGFYPAIYISAYKPIKILKGDIRSGVRGEIFRKLIFVVQFSISLIFISSSILVFQQFHLLDRTTMAYSDYYIINIPVKGINRIDDFIIAVKNNENIKSVEYPFINKNSEIPKINSIDKAFLRLKIEQWNFQRTLDYLEQKWNKYHFGMEFQFTFENKEFEKLYNYGELRKDIFYLFIIIVVIISCIGLFGHSSFMIKQKTNEIALRKTFGATFGNILFMMLGEYVKLVFVSNLIAFFFVIWILNTWFSRFAFRIDISGIVFLKTLLISLTLSILTALYHSIKASLLNPAVNLRNE